MDDTDRLAVGTVQSLPPTPLGRAKEQKRIKQRPPTIIKSPTWCYLTDSRPPWQTKQLCTLFFHLFLGKQKPRMKAVIFSYVWLIR